MDTIEPVQGPSGPELWIYFRRRCVRCERRVQTLICQGCDDAVCRQCLHATRPSSDGKSVPACEDCVEAGREYALYGIWAG